MTEFEWDEEKAGLNERKHGVLFEKATEVFDDKLAVYRQNRIVDGEERWQVTGMTSDNRLLLRIIYTTREEGEQEIIRIISARRAKGKEIRQYEHG